MNRHTLPTHLKIAEKDVPIETDYRSILDIFEVLNDPDLLDIERTMVALSMFYDTEDYLDDVDEAIRQMFDFMRAGEPEPIIKDEQPLYSWDQDFNIIVAPINRVLGTDVRGLEYLHWWTFLSAFMEIGECTFSTYVSLRDKMNKGKRIEKWEQKIISENRDKIILKKKVDSTTQDIIDDIMGD